jgi:hypothetical protein
MDYNEFTDVAQLEDIYRHCVRQYDAAKKAKQFGHADECATKAHLISKRLITQFGVSEQHITELCNEALATA